MCWSRVWGLANWGPKVRYVLEGVVDAAGLQYLGPGIAFVEGEEGVQGVGDSQHRALADLQLAYLYFDLVPDIANVDQVRAEPLEEFHEYRRGFLVQAGLADHLRRLIL